MHAKNEIVSVVRGYCALPVIMAFSRRGWLEHLQNDGLAASTVAGQSRHAMSAMRYLANLGWVEQRQDRWLSTELGRKVLSRAGAFGIVHSYREYLEHVEALLFDAGSLPHIERTANVVGSGAAHREKFFSRMRDVLMQTQARYLLDIGCGDGTFLNYAKSIRPDLKLIGLDYSETALAQTRLAHGADIMLLRGSVAQPAVIQDMLRAQGLVNGEVLISVWFIFHEVLAHEDVNLTRLLTDYRAMTAQHGLIIGEIFDVPTPLLAATHGDTAVPEFSFLHDLSGQKLFSLASWRQHILASGYREGVFVGLDETTWMGATYNASGVWHLL